MAGLSERKIEVSDSCRTVTHRRTFYLRERTQDTEPSGIRCFRQELHDNSAGLEQPGRAHTSMGGDSRRIVFGTRNPDQTLCIVDYRNVGSLSRCDNLCLFNRPGHRLRLFWVRQFVRGKDRYLPPASRRSIVSGFSVHLAGR